MNSSSARSTLLRSAGSGAAPLEKGWGAPPRLLSLHLLLRLMLVLLLPGLLPQSLVDPPVPRWRRPLLLLWWWVGAGEGGEAGGMCAPDVRGAFSAVLAAPNWRWVVGLAVGLGLGRCRSGGLMRGQWWVAWGMMLVPRLRLDIAAADLPELLHEELLVQGTM
jgi:hypothetical protein